MFKLSCTSLTSLMLQIMPALTFYRTLFPWSVYISVDDEVGRFTLSVSVEIDDKSVSVSEWSVKMWWMIYCWKNTATCFIDRTAVGRDIGLPLAFRWNSTGDSARRRLSSQWPIACLLQIVSQCLCIYTDYWEVNLWREAGTGVNYGGRGRVPQRCRA